MKMQQNIGNQLLVLCVRQIPSCITRDKLKSILYTYGSSLVSLSVSSNRCLESNLGFELNLNCGDYLLGPTTTTPASIPKDQHKLHVLFAGKLV